MKKTSLLLTVVAIVLVLSVSIGTALAYFTTYTHAAGKLTLRLPPHSSELTEKITAWTKHVSIENKSGSGPVYIRAKAIASGSVDLTYTDPDGKWTPGDDGYYYYQPIVNGGESTSELLVSIGNVPAEPKEGDSFNVLVLYESTPVAYREDGTPYADWTAILDKGVSEGGND